MQSTVQVFNPWERQRSEMVKSLEAKYYTDPKIFNKERTSLFYKTWQFACHESTIPTSGDYFSFELAGESLFCIRGIDGQVRTFYNVCQHRAHQLLKGKGSTSVIVCPYHAWSYEVSGELRSGPNIKVAGINKKWICL